MKYFWLSAVMFVVSINTFNQKSDSAIVNLSAGGFRKQQSLFYKYCATSDETLKKVSGLHLEKESSYLAGFDQSCFSHKDDS